MGIFERMAEENVNRITVLQDRSSITGKFNTLDVTVAMCHGGHERLIFIFHPEVNLKAIIAIHDRTLGKSSIGGVRIVNYDNEKEMIYDALELSKAMTNKASIAGMDRGGGKCVVWCNPKTEKSVNLFLKLAEEIDKLNGDFIAGADMNVDEKDILLMRSKTSYVSGLPITYYDGSYRGSGDPSPVTAKGVVYGIKACLKFLNMGSIDGKTIAIQGLGKVGYRLARFLYQEGARLIVCDVKDRRIKHFEEEFQHNALRDFRESTKIVEPDEIYSQNCDIFAPCARGGIINPETVHLLNCRIIAGPTNNQLSSEYVGKTIIERRILYAPDYVINAGGLISVDDEKHPDGYSELRVQAKLENIPKNLLRVFWLSRKLEIPTNLVADMLAEERIELKKILDQGVK